jgi:hypothetical protein
MKTKLLVTFGIIVGLTGLTGLTGCTTTQVENAQPKPTVSVRASQTQEPFTPKHTKTISTNIASNSSGGNSVGNSVGNDHNIFTSYSGGNSNGNDEVSNDIIATDLYLSMFNLKQWYNLSDETYSPRAIIDNDSMLLDWANEARSFCSTSESESLKALLARKVVNAEYKVLYAAALESVCPEQKSLVNIAFPGGNPKTTFLK